MFGTTQKNSTSEKEKNKLSMCPEDCATPTHTVVVAKPKMEL